MERSKIGNETTYGTRNYLQTKSKSQAVVIVFVSGPWKSALPLILQYYQCDSAIEQRHIHWIVSVRMSVWHHVICYKVLVGTSEITSLNTTV